MNKRLIIIFSIFIAVALGACVFIYFYRQQAEGWLKGYVSKITVCENILAEPDCFAKDFCEGIYGPVSAGSPELKFKGCRRIQAKGLAQLRTEKELCQSTGGDWHRNQFGNFCLCLNHGERKVFDKNLGCVNK